MAAQIGILYKHGGKQTQAEAVMGFSDTPSSSVPEVKCWHNVTIPGRHTGEPVRKNDDAGFGYLDGKQTTLHFLEITMTTVSRSRAIRGSELWQTTPEEANVKTTSDYRGINDQLRFSHWHHRFGNLTSEGTRKTRSKGKQASKISHILKMKSITKTERGISRVLIAIYHVVQNSIDYDEVCRL